MSDGLGNKGSAVSIQNISTKFYRSITIHLMHPLVYCHMSRKRKSLV
jgi:hypothetical protein